jgi:ATP:ADP antiporter, AAA family
VTQRLGQLFRLRPGETGLVLTLGFLLFANSVAQPLAEITAVANFLPEVGVNNILLVWIVDALLAFVITGGQSLIIDRFNRKRLLQGLCAVLAVVFGVLWLMVVLGAPAWLNYGLLYLVAQQQWLVYPMIFWVLANDVLDMSQAKRLFPLMASLGFVGRLAGIGLALLWPGLMAQLGLPAQSVLLFCVVVYLAALAVALPGLRRTRVRHTAYRTESVRETLAEGWDFVREVPLFRFLALVTLALIVCETFLEFHFLAVTERTFTTAASYQMFYSLYRLGLTVASIVVQAFLTSRIIGRIGLKNAFLILPIAALAGATWMLAAATSIVSAVGGVVLQKLPQFTIDESARKSFQSLVPEERRGRVSVFIDSYLYSAASIAGSLLTGAVVLIGLRFGLVHYYYGYLAMAVAAAGVGLWAALRLRQVYDSSMLNWRLKRRERRSSVLDKLQF